MGSYALGRIHCEIRLLACLPLGCIISSQAELRATFTKCSVPKGLESEDSSKDQNFHVESTVQCLLVNDGLLASGMKIDPRCQMCGYEGESINHILFTCPLARVVWAQTNFPFPRCGF